MTTTPDVAGGRLLDYLLPAADGDPHERLHRRLRDAVQTETLDAAGVPGIAHELVWAELAQVLGRTLATDLTEIVSDGWRAGAALHAAAVRTLARPGTTEVVTLAEHTITFDALPEIELMVDGAQAALITVRLTAEVRVTALAAGIRGGRLVEFRCGDAELTAALHVNDVAVAARRVRVDLEAVLPVGAGIVLAAPAVPAPPAALVLPGPPAVPAALVAPAVPVQPDSDRSSIG